MEIYIVTQGVTFDESGWNYSQVSMSVLGRTITCSVCFPLAQKCFP